MIYVSLFVYLCSGFLHSFLSHSLCCVFCVSILLKTLSVAGIIQGVYKVVVMCLLKTRQMNTLIINHVSYISYEYYYIYNVKQYHSISI
jgi:hypothetical protein